MVECVTMKISVVLALVAMVSVSFARAEVTPDLLVAPAELRGVVLYPDGATAVDRLRVRVWDADTEEVIYRKRTDGDGVFVVPKLKEGSHYVTVGPVRIDMRILTPRAGITPQQHGVLVVIPKHMPATSIVVPGAVTAGLLPRDVSP